MLLSHGSCDWAPWTTYLIAILCVFSTLINGYDLSERRQPQGPLGVALDYSLATTWPVGLNANPPVSRNWMFSSHIKFNQPVSDITPGQLWSIALDAYAEIMPERQQYQMPDKAQPGAMTVLAFGNELILASSQKGKNSFSYQFPNTRVLETLRLCQATYRATSVSGGDQEHRPAGKCGEIMAAHLYYTLYDAPLGDQKPRVATVVLNPRDGVLYPTDPCGDSQEDYWGCNLFIGAEDLTAIDTGTRRLPYTLETLAGGITSRDQIQLCSHRQT